MAWGDLSLVSGRVNYSSLRVAQLMLFRDAGVV